MRIHTRSLLTATLTLLSTAARAEDRPATPSNYRTVVTTLQPGDTLRLAAGAYGLLNVSNLHGRADAPIVIAGPATGDPAVFHADPGPCCNTIELRNATWIVLRDLTVDGGGVAGAFGVSAGGGTGNVVHDITVEGCTFLRHDGSQQTVAISTKTPTWGWVIRNNVISGAGTGLYLGNSDGTMPFIGGLIEHNLIENTVGYGMEIKYQRARPALAGMPTEPTSTIIRHNVWIKTDRASPDGDRPNLLVGGYPDTGLGAMDRYEIYGNVFLHNARESLLQASGRVTIHDNVFVDVTGTAILLRNHDLPLRQAFVYGNTIYAAGRGVVFGSAAPQGDAVVGNVIFSATPITGTITTQHDNVTDIVANAAMYVGAPSTTPGMMDFYPRAGRCQGPALDVSPFSADRDVDRDFNCAPRGSRTFRGAYAGEGSNPGWRIVAARKPVGAGCMPMSTVDAGVPDAGVIDAGVPDAVMVDAGAPDGVDVTPVDTATDAVTADLATTDATPTTTPPSSGCGCATRRASDLRGVWAALSLGALAVRRRRRAGFRPTADRGRTRAERRGVL